MNILGVWMWPQSIRERGAQHTVSLCRRAGVTDIFFLVKGLAGTTAHLSRLAPACCERDLLDELLAAAHAQGVRVHAWLTSASDEHYKRQHPESGRCHYVRGKDNGLISLADGGYLHYMERIVRELCAGYAIDGLHLDYIRYNHLLYGWALEDLERYAAQGADIARLRAMMDKTFIAEDKDPEHIFDAFRAGDKDALALARARRQDVVRFASRLIRAAREEKSDLLLSAALMPEGAYDDTAFADLHYGQNYEDAAALYDLALPMAYSKAYEKDSQWVRSVAQGTLRRGLKTVMGLHAYDGGTGPSLAGDIAALDVSSVSGICLFREGACVFSFACGQTLTVFNPLSQPLTRVIAGAAEQSAELECSISPGEAMRFALPFTPDAVRAFAGNAEQCVYLTQERQ
ncbi:MAG: hypothetical protein IKU34_11315 [Clostridia bacterium]|nr:hypothetical protein [Clostridia bacterium]